MSTHKHIDKICCVVLALTLIITVLFMNGEKLGIQKMTASFGYESRLFDTSAVHTVDIVMDNWDEFISECKSEEYYPCSLVIDNEAYKNVAIRGKGNTSLTQVESYGNDRYSFKVEFDHYDSSKNYYGLDKLCLNNIIQDNTYMKDYLTYRMMNEFGVASPLCSFVYVTVNGEDWGLYIAVEGIEEAFLERNYGSDYGELYKPDSMSMGGGRGNGRDFDIGDFTDNNTDDGTTSKEEKFDFSNIPDMPDIGSMNDGEEMQIPNGEDFSFDNITPPSGDGENGGKDFGGKGGMFGSSDDVLLKYIDDDPDSYSNIFDNAKTTVTESDKKRLIASLKNLSEGEELESTVDIERVIRYFVVHNFVLNFDSYTGSMIHNYYLYEKDGQMQMIPWDYNLAFGGFQAAGGATSLVNYPIDSPVSGGNAEDRPMIAWIFANEEYTELYHQYFSEFISEYFDSGYFEKLYDEAVEMITPYVEKDPTKFCTLEEFETGAATLREFCLLRAESISGQLDGTIGSTSDTQKNETLIDAGDMQISDMGSMNNSMGGGRGDMPSFDFDLSDFEFDASDFDFSDGNIPKMSRGGKGSRSDEKQTATTETAMLSLSTGGMKNQNGNPPEMPQNGGMSMDGMPQMPSGEMPEGDVLQMPNGEMPEGDMPQMPNGEMPEGNIPQKPENDEAAQTTDTAEAASEADEGSTATTDTPESSRDNQDADREKPNGEKHDNTDRVPNGKSGIDSSTVIMLAVSVAVLAAGLVFAFSFKRRK